MTVAERGARGAVDDGHLAEDHPGGGVRDALAGAVFEREKCGDDAAGDPAIVPAATFLCAIFIRKA